MICNTKSHNLEMIITWLCFQIGHYCYRNRPTGFQMVRNILSFTNILNTNLNSRKEFISYLIISILFLWETSSDWPSFSRVSILSRGKRSSSWHSFSTVVVILILIKIIGYSPFRGNAPSRIFHSSFSISSPCGGL